MECSLVSETITQADRDAVADYLSARARASFANSKEPHAALLLDAFARHRIKAKMRGALAMRDAADILEDYAEYIRSVKACELERHPYLPQVEEVISELRAAIGESHE